MMNNKRYFTMTMATRYPKRRWMQSLNNNRCKCSNNNRKNMSRRSRKKPRDKVKKNSPAKGSNRKRLTTMTKRPTTEYFIHTMITLFALRTNI